MLIDREWVSKDPGMAQALDRAPALARFLDLVASDPEGFAIDTSAAGLDLMPLVDSAAASARCRLKVFQP
ncbi:MAG TPA: hypothetical protein VFD83_02585, partial [Candidatus Polarisedimenticolia bacterium]|nr:hypothetical protein [Candidatus Polarisedimenticolia bacterium]